MHAVHTRHGLLLTELAGGGPVLLTTAGFGRSFVRDAAYRFRAAHRDLDLKLAWRRFANLADWGTRWPAEQKAFAGGLILSAAEDPVVERAVGRCLADLYQLGRPVLWGAISDRVCPPHSLERPEELAILTKGKTAPPTIWMRETQLGQIKPALGQTASTRPMFPFGMRRAG